MSWKTALQSLVDRNNAEDVDETDAEPRPAAPTTWKNRLSDLVSRIQTSARPVNDDHESRSADDANVTDEAPNADTSNADETPPEGPEISAADSLTRHAKTAILLMMLFGGSISAWSLTFKIDGAVVAHGTVAVEHSVKKVQHPTGGIIRALNVVEGQYVDMGDILLRLDDTVTRANLGIIMNDLTAQRARQARLQAERDGKSEIKFPADLIERARTEPEVANVLSGEQTVFRSRATTRNGQKQQLTERIGQLRDEIKGAEEQLVATRKQTVLAKDELKDLTSLWRKGLVPRTRVSQLEREIMRNDGLAGELIARVAQSQGRISETEVQVIQLDRDLATEVAKDLRDAETKIAELQERRSAAEDQLRRVDVRAPISGHVHQLNVHTVGGVVNQAEPMMSIVPDADRLIVDARINPMDIDRVQMDQETMVRLSAFNSHTTPTLIGKVTRIGADMSKDPQTQQTFFTVGITIGEDELEKLRGLKLVPGMPAEAYIKTGGRTFVSYLMKPIWDQFHRALRED